ncbi:hypothetical protein ATCC90586_000743 [Pythium insidiosum]|nr:hypothetical protein ATCC90586_000743 [Pythium insidiosum]
MARHHARRHQWPLLLLVAVVVAVGVYELHLLRQLVKPSGLVGPDVRERAAVLALRVPDRGSSERSAVLESNAPSADAPALRRELDDQALNATTSVPDSTTAPPATAPVPRSTAAPPVDRSRGIIIALHDGIVAMGASLIRELRCLGNSEVIQVYHCFPDELSAESRAMLTRGVSNVEIIDVCSAMLKRDPTADMKVLQSFKSYWVKPLAVYHSSLKEIILLDADVILLQDPAVVRSLAGYNRTGTTFFYDRVSPINKFLNRVGVPLRALGASAVRNAAQLARVQGRHGA